PVPPELVNHPRYRVLKMLGQGGMGAVYLAEHLVMGRRVAIKTISAHFLSNHEAVGRFRREVRAAAKLAHPNVVAAHDADQAARSWRPARRSASGATPGARGRCRWRRRAPSAPRRPSACSTRTRRGWSTATSSRAT